MYELIKFLKRIWHFSKLQFIIWSILIIGVIPFFLVPLLTGYIEELLLSEMVISNKILIPVICYLSILLLIETPTLFVLKWIYNIHNRVARWSKIRSKLKESIKNLTYHLIDDSTVNKVYGSMLISKLVGVHEPNENISGSFCFIRHEKDFECFPGTQTLVQPREQLLNHQIIDFNTIQQCLRKSWHTTAYGDIAVLLQKPEYIAQNAKMRRRKYRKINIQRLFIYPYYKGNPKNLLNELKHLQLDSRTIDMLISDRISGPPSTSIDTIMKKISGITPKAARSICDVIYLMWLVTLHEEFKIDYRLLSRFNTRDAKNIDIVGANILFGWHDEGSALIDNQLIVRFDDKQNSKGVIYYEFIKDTNKVTNYKEAFKEIWRAGLPPAFKLKRHDHSNDLISFLNSFFNGVTANNIYNIKTHNTTNKWIEIIHDELITK